MFGFSRFSRQCGGNVALTFAISAVPLLAVVAVAVEYGRSTNTHAKLQKATDNATLAAAGALLESESARTLVAHNFLSSYDNFITKDKPIVESVVFTDDKITVKTRLALSTAFGGMFGVTHTDIAATATAIARPAEAICLLALNKTAPNAISFQGTTVLDAPDCVVHSNSSSASSLYADGSSSAVAKEFCSAGGYSGSSFSPTPNTDCKVLDDPYAGLPKPADLTCDFRLGAINSNRTLNPGVYCGGLNIKAKVTFTPGTYVIKDGTLNIQAGGNAVGDDVAFYFTGSNTGITIRGGASAALKAPATGDYAGLLFAQDPMSNKGNDKNQIQGGGSLEFTGTLYFPTQTIAVGGNGSVAGYSPQFTMIADKFTFKGNGTVSLSVDNVAANLPKIKPYFKSYVRLVK